MLKPPILRHFLSVQSLNVDNITYLLDRAEFFLKGAVAKQEVLPTLRGKVIINLFFEPSTRTRSSFELAAKRLKANTLVLTKEASSTEKGETLIDTARTIEAMAPDVLVLRHPSAGSPHHLDRRLNIPIINGFRIS